MSIGEVYMARAPAVPSLDSVVRDAVRPLVERASAVIAKSIALIVAEQLESKLRESAVLKPKKGAKTGTKRGRSRPRGDIKKWSADRRARRVPTFVIEATGLDTKKKIVAKYGENATFQKGKPLPKAA
jgi:hypothetical protein